MAKSASATDILPHGDADEPLLHGGDLGAFRAQFPNAPEPLVDLSTGINPTPYPLPPLPAALFARLPDAAATADLAAVAASCYGAPSAAHVVPAPGTQILLPLVAGLVRPGRAAILSPTYGEHARAAQLAGHSVVETGDLGALADARLAIVGNPNNPDGRLIDRASLLTLAAQLRGRGGLLVVDEAFMEVASPGLSLAGEVARGNLVVLRSFGKFFGLAGVRLGFALLEPQLAARLAAMLGPWAVSGPALAVGTRALADTQWIERTRADLAEAARKLDSILTGADLDVLGGTSLFRLVRTAAARALVSHLGRAGIAVRAFPEHQSWLRFGLPADDDAWRRLEMAMAAFRDRG
jgi:cobalamin biosynthetic protein CobC